jgi:hypothetical protein
MAAIWRPGMEITDAIASHLNAFLLYMQLLTFAAILSTRLCSTLFGTMKGLRRNS